VAGFCENGNEPLGFHKESRLLFDMLSDFPKNNLHHGVSE
jgi:hypothetical protein